MLGAVLGGLAFMAGLALLLNWYASTSPKAILRAARWGGVGLAIVTVFILAITGKLQFLWAALFWLLPWLTRGRALADLWRRMKPRTAGQTSRVETRLVEMRLDHDSGEMDGLLREGPHAGRLLSSLTTAEVLDMLQLAQGDDPRAAPLIEAYLDRMRPDWREAAGGPSEAGKTSSSGGNGNTGGRGPRPRAGLGRAEALEILGLSGNPDEAEIRAAHRRLMKQVHPDQGGSDALAARVNAAKDVLLDGLRKSR